jgi:Carboxypeptidase regulatory-like domain
MRSRWIAGWVCCAFLLTAVVLGSDKQSGPVQSSNVHFTVLKDDNNKPVRNASIVLHPVGKNGKQSKGGFEIKTDNDGKVVYEGLPYGLLRVQVLAPGFQTYGEDFQINKPEMDVAIRLKRPTDQLSVYGDGKEPPKTAPTTAPPATPPAQPKPQ